MKSSAKKLVIFIQKGKYMVKHQSEQDKFNLNNLRFTPKHQRGYGRDVVDVL